MFVAVLAATLLLLSGGKKKKRSKSGSGSAQDRLTPVRAHLMFERGDPWSLCDPPPGSPKGTQAAFSKDGTQCMVFWRPDTDAAVRQTIQQELLKLPKAERNALCAVSKCESDPFALESEAFCKWIPDQMRVEFVKQIILSLWPQIPTAMLPPPPPDALGRINSPHFVLYVWTRVMDVFAKEFCGFNQVT